MDKTPVQLYYWSVKFNDGYIFNQFESNGVENTIRGFCPRKYINSDNTVQENVNVFEDLESEHGRVTKIGWYPFTEELARKCMEKQPSLRIAVSPEIKSVEQIVPDNFYSTYLKKINEIKYGIQRKDDGIQMIPLESLVSEIHMTVVPRNDREAKPLVSSIKVNYK